jgi:hypothetical protein
MAHPPTRVAQVLAVLLGSILLASIAFSQSSEETALWESVKDSKVADDYRAYLDKYPDGVYAPLAKRRIAGLQSNTSASVGDRPAETSNQEPADAGTKRMGAGAIRMIECEGTNNCATWTFLGTQGNGHWPSGEVASLRVERFDADSVAIHRADSDGPSSGLSAEYKGSRHGDRIGGEFTSSWPGHWENKTGNWYATIDKSLVGIPHVAHVCIHCEQGKGATWVWEDGQFENVAHIGGTTETVTVESFTRESVVLHVKRVGSYSGTGVITGQISPEGNRLVNGWYRADGNPSADHPFQMAWGSALDSVRGDYAYTPPAALLVAAPIVCVPWFFSVVCY